MGVPATLLRRWYVEGSLRNTSQGFTFTLKNRLAPATVVQVIEAHAMGHVYLPETIWLEHRNGAGVTRWIWGKHISRANPFLFQINDVVRVHIRGARLAPGHHLITLELEVLEVGNLRVPVEDDIPAVQATRRLSLVSSCPHSVSQSIK